MRNLKVSACQEPCGPARPRRLRIAIDGRPALWPRTGIGTIVKNVLLRLAHSDTGNDYYFYFDRRPEFTATQVGAVRIRYQEGLHPLLWVNTYVPIQLQRDRIDIYLSFLEKDVPFFTRDTKYISMVHDLIPLLFPDTVFRSSIHKLYYSRMLRASTSQSDLILTNSEHSKCEIVTALGIPRSKLHTIRLGVDPVPCQDRATIAGVLRKYSIRQPYIFALGSTEPRKNNAAVIRAFRLIRSQFPLLQLVIAGKPWRGRQFDPALLDDGIVQTGFVADDEMYSLYRAAEAFVFPSLHEGFGLPLIEAMACGVPVIASNVAALPEVAADAALYCDPRSDSSIATALADVLSNPVLAGDLRVKGLSRAQLFKWEDTCFQIAAACAKVGNVACPVTERKE